MSKEIKVYVINCSEDFDFRAKQQMSDYEAIMTKAEELGSVYSLQGFQDASNNEELLLDNSFILIK